MRAGLRALRRPGGPRCSAALRADLGAGGAPLLPPGAPVLEAASGGKFYNDSGLVVRVWRFLYGFCRCSGAPVGVSGLLFCFTFFVMFRAALGFIPPSGCHIVSEAL